MIISLFEKLFYKICFDLFESFDLYNFSITKLVMKKVSSNGKLYTSSYNSINDFINYVGLLDNKISGLCITGEIFYIDSVEIESTNGLIVNFTIRDFNGLYTIDNKNIKTNNQFEKNTITEKISKLIDLITMYQKLYKYINILNSGIFEYYSPCYFEAGYTNDIIPTDNFNILLKYNLFITNEKNINNILDKEQIKKILS